jgi:hypothetical protein
MAEFTQGTCETEWCPNDRRKLSPFCASCVAGHTRAEKLGPGWIVQRQQKLSKWQSRMIYMAVRKPTQGFKNAVKYVKKHSGR